MLTLVILAGGLATRLGSLTTDTPKSLIEIAGKPFVDWQLRLLSKSGIEKVVFCLAHKGEAVREFVGDGSKYGIQVLYSYDGTTQLGTGGAVKKAADLLGDEFMTLYGDSYLPIDYQKVQNAYYRLGKPALMTVYRNQDSFDASNVIFKSGMLQRYAKGVTTVKYSHIDFGLSVFKKTVFDPYPTGRKFDLSDVCTTLSDSNLLAGFELYERFYEIGSLEGIQDFRRYLEENYNVI